KFTRIPMTIQEISTVLKFTSGPISDEFQPSIFNRRHVPSAGGLYPYETYVAINNVEDVQEGLYHYNVLEHSLDLLKKGDFRERLSAAALNQGMVASAAAVLLWAAIASLQVHFSRLGPPGAEFLPRIRGVKPWLLHDRGVLR
ncbi:MAG: SagB/ThcOx family dehydrogenase, partial [Promethearchaeota archaeon]